jgi:aspartyl-tRNA synthetase
MISILNKTFSSTNIRYNTGKINIPHMILKNIYRTHDCNELNKKNIGENVSLAGWIFRKRSHGGILFIDLRDHYGVTQIVFHEKDLIEKIEKIKLESVIFIKGCVVERSQENYNKNLHSGEIEVNVAELIIESEANELPLQVDNNEKYTNDLRWKYRFLDLRRQYCHNNIILRSKFINKLRQEMNDKGFLEFQTPILTASSPEGARDFLVPSRTHPGKFYALPQAPQQFKQLLMVSGFDKYFQIAPCFRDEDSRADRSPGEFYQLDIEMSFVTQEDIFQTIEPVIYYSFRQFTDFKINKFPFPRIKYTDSMLKYGSDKPDLRNPLIIQDVTDIFDGSTFSIFANAIKNTKDKGRDRSIVRALLIPNIAEMGRAFCDKKNDYAIENLGVKGLGYIIFGKDEQGKPEAKGPIAKNLGEEKTNELKKKIGAKDGDTVFFSCDTEKIVVKCLGEMRKLIADELNLINKKEFIFCWVTDFPMYELNDEGVIDFSHNPFSMPQGGMDILKDADELKGDARIDALLKIDAYQYDLVCNGIEISSGAIRNHKPEIMYKAFEIAGYSKEQVDSKFSGMINAFKYGAPPHGGIAPGVDRMVMLLCNEPNIREVIAFPLNQSGQDLMMSAPCEVSERQLKELHLSSTVKKKNENA